MRYDIEEVWGPMQKEFLDNQGKIEEKALKLYRKSKKRAIKFLTNYSMDCGNKVIERAWKLGDELWTKYDEKF